MSLPSINFLHLTVGQDFIGQGHYGKVKGQIKVRLWRCTPTTPNQCPYTVSFLHLMVSDIAQTRFYMSRSLRQDQIKVRPWRSTPTPPNQCPYQVSTSYTLRFPRYSPDKIFKLKVTTARSKVKSMSDHDVAHLHILTNVPTKYQLPTPYGFWDTARRKTFPVDRPPIQTPWVKTIPHSP